MTMETVVVLFTRDLRVHDNPALAASVRAAKTVVPLFVHDPSLRRGDNRDRLLREALGDLRGALRKRGGDLVERHGDPVREAVAMALATNATGIAVAGDASVYAHRRERRLADACATARLAYKVFPGVTIVPPGELRPSGGGDHYRVFTPYWRAWQSVRWRDVEPAPRRISLPEGLAVDRAPTSAGGETAGRAALTRWSRVVSGYGKRHDDLAADGTSRLSPYLHFGCVSAREVAARVGDAEPFLRQLCWRDFYHQVLHAFGELARKAYRSGAQERWSTDTGALDAWRAGRTGVPIVDAGMRQLLAEGWMHNRARLITASYLTKDLNLDWRLGADHFYDLLADGDIANNYGNWQWVAGTGNDTKPYRRFNPARQAERFDPDGEYVRRWVPEVDRPEYRQQLRQAPVSR